MMTKSAKFGRNTFRSILIPFFFAALYQKLRQRSRRSNHNFKSSTQFFMTLSMYSIVAIALHRCYGLITPGASNFDSKRNILLFSLAWLVSFAITIPVFLRSKVHQNRDEKICSVIYASWKFSMQFCNLCYYNKYWEFLESQLSETECLELFQRGNFSVDECHVTIHNNFISSCERWKPKLEMVPDLSFLNS